MRLKSSIFLWVSLATIIPLTALVLGITAYSERLYRHNVDDSIQAGMKNIVSELEFRFNYEQEVMLSLASSPAMKQMVVTLNAATRGELPASYYKEIASLNDFLTGFQHSVPGVDLVRVMDQGGNTLVKVEFGKPPGDGREKYQTEKIDVEFLKRIRQLRPHTLLYGDLYLPQDQPSETAELAANEYLAALLNPIVPLDNAQGDAVGFLAAESLGVQLDHLLQVLPRSHNFRIEIVELNAANAQRHGLILYSDQQSILFNQSHHFTPKLWQQLDQQIWSQIERDSQGSFALDESSQLFYYQEFYPYNNQQVSWIVMLQIDEEELTAPFNRIRLGLLVFAVLALFISLALANLGARNIANPIEKFSNALKRFADGEKGTEFRLSQSIQTAEELLQLEQSFKYLVTTLKHSEDERDRAQKMMLQQAKLASIGEMAAGIGHEINNPLNNILSYVKLIERDLPAGNSQFHQDLDGLRDEALRAGRIVKGVLNFARQVPPEYSCFDLQAWLQESVLLVATETRKRHVKTCLLDVPKLEICGDRHQLQQVMVNLLMNAIQISQPQQIVEIYAQRLGTQLVQIVVSDQGTGLDEKNKAKVFDPFYTTKAVGEGSGLGLSISLGIVQYHNGLLELENNQKGGVDATITLPLTEQNDDPE